MKGIGLGRLWRRLQTGWRGVCFGQPEAPTLYQPVSSSNSAMNCSWTLIQDSRFIGCRLLPMKRKCGGWKIPVHRNFYTIIEYWTCSLPFRHSKAARIWKWHPKHLFSNREDILFSNNMLWMLVSVEKLIALGRQLMERGSGTLHTCNSGRHLQWLSWISVLLSCSTLSVPLCTEWRIRSFRLHQCWRRLACEICRQEWTWKNISSS